MAKFLSIQRISDGFLKCIDRFVDKDSNYELHSEENRKVTFCFLINFIVQLCNSMLLPLREAIVLPLESSYMSDLMMATTLVSIVGTFMTSW